MTLQKLIKEKNSFNRDDSEAKIGAPKWISFDSKEAPGGGGKGGTADLLKDPTSVKVGGIPVGINTNEVACVLEQVLGGFKIDSASILSVYRKKGHRGSGSVSLSSGDISVRLVNPDIVGEIIKLPEIDLKIRGRSVTLRFGEEVIGSDPDCSKFTECIFDESNTCSTPMGSIFKYKSEVGISMDDFAKI